MFTLSFERRADKNDKTFKKVFLLIPFTYKQRLITRLRLQRLVNVEKILVNFDIIINTRMR